jgi:hypothetical protein
LTIYVWLGEKTERRRKTGDLKDKLGLVVDDEPENIDYISAIL